MASRNLAWIMVGGLVFTTACESDVDRRNRHAAEKLERAQKRRREAERAKEKRELVEAEKLFNRVRHLMAIAKRCGMAKCAKRNRAFKQSLKLGKEVRDLHDQVRNLDIKESLAKLGTWCGYVGLALSPDRGTRLSGFKWARDFLPTVNGTFAVASRSVRRKH